MVLKATIIDDTVLDQFSGQPQQYNEPQQPKSKAQIKQNLSTNQNGIIP